MKKDRESKVVEKWLEVWKKEYPKPVILRFASTGAPDFMLCRPDGEVTFYEMKRPKGMLRGRQKVVIDILKELGHKVVVIKDYPPNLKE